METEINALENKHKIKANKYKHQSKSISQELDNGT